MNGIDGNILYQSIDPLTKTVSPEFYKQFSSVGEETLNLFVELKTAMTSNFTKKNENIIIFLRKLDEQLPNLPSPIQTWFKKFYKIRMSNEIKAGLLSKGQLKSLDKNYSFDAMNRVVDALNWFTPNTVTPYNALEQKVPCNMGTLPKGVNSADTALYVSKLTKFPNIFNNIVEYFIEIKDNKKLLTNDFVLFKIKCNENNFYLNSNLILRENPKYKDNNINKYDDEYEKSIKLYNDFLTFLK